MSGMPETILGQYFKNVSGSGLNFKLRWTKMFNKVSRKKYVGLLSFDTNLINQSHRDSPLFNLLNKVQQMCFQNIFMLKDNIFHPEYKQKLFLKKLQLIIKLFWLIFLNFLSLYIELTGMSLKIIMQLWKDNLQQIRYFSHWKITEILLYNPDFFLQQKNLEYMFYMSFEYGFPSKKNQEQNK